MKSKRLTVVNVSARHIADGDQGDCHSCPVALAITETVREELEVHVMHTDVEVGELFTCGGSQRIGLPFAVRQWIAEFDRRRPVVPLSFVLRIREDFLRERTPDA